MFIARRGLLIALTVLAFGCAKPAPAEAPLISALEPLEIVTTQGKVSLQVEIADEEPERQQGLMYRTRLEDDRGMLFDFDPPREVAFWMKNTLIPLDMIFIGADGRITNIARNTRPYSLDATPSQSVVRGVLEVGGGRAAAMGVRVGDKVNHRFYPQ